VSNKFEYKKQLSKKMMNLKNKFLEKGKEYRIDAFLNKAFFNS
jgi:hypothetical protein